MTATPNCRGQIPFAVFDTTTGFFLRTGLAPVDDAPNQPIGAGEAIILPDTPVDVDTQKVDLDTGEIVSR